jgi:hypothetical protein
MTVAKRKMCTIRELDAYAGVSLAREGAAARSPVTRRKRRLLGLTDTTRPG